MQVCLNFKMIQFYLINLAVDFEHKTKLFTGQTMAAGFWLLKQPSPTNIV
jgi:hypothetical protein